MIQASPISVLLGLGLLVGRLPLIETMRHGSHGSRESYESRESHASHMATAMKKLIMISYKKVLIEENVSKAYISIVFVDKNYSVDQDDTITFMWERGTL